MTTTDDTSNSDRPPALAARASDPARAYKSLATVLSVLILAGVVGALLQTVWGASSPETWSFLLAGVVSGVVAILGSLLLGRRASSSRGHGGISWIAFPMTLLGSVAMIPLLLLSTVPEARGWLKPATRIEARYVDARLEILFPRPTDGETINLTFDSTTIPPDHFARNPGHGEWRFHRGQNNRLLRLDVEELAASFEIKGAKRIGINANLDADQVFYANGERITQQWVRLPDRAAR